MSSQNYHAYDLILVARIDGMENRRQDNMHDQSELRPVHSDVPNHHNRCGRLWRVSQQFDFPSNHVG